MDEKGGTDADRLAEIRARNGAALTLIERDWEIKFLLRLLDAATSRPEGAEEITQKMIESGIATLGADEDRPTALIASDLYRAMRAARPSAPGPSEADVERER